MQEERKNKTIDYPFFALHNNSLITEQQQQSMTDVISVTTELRAEKRINQLKAILSDIDRELQGTHYTNQYYTTSEVLKDYEHLEIQIQDKKNELLAQGEKKLAELRNEVMFAINQISLHKLEINAYNAQENELGSIIKRIEEAISNKSYADIENLMKEATIEEARQKTKNTIESFKIELPNLEMYSNKLKEIVAEMKVNVAEALKNNIVITQSTGNLKTSQLIIPNWPRMSQYCVCVLPYEKIGISYNCLIKKAEKVSLDAKIPENFGICQWENNVVICGGNDKDNKFLNEVIFLTLPGFTPKMTLPAMKKAKRKATLVYIHCNIIISLGGEEMKNDIATHISICEFLEIGEKVWKESMPLSVARRSITAFNFRDKFVFALNGKTNSGTEIMCERLKLNSKLGMEKEPWETIKIKGIEPRVSASVGFDLDDSSFVLLGGEIGFNSYSDEILKGQIGDDSIEFEKYGNLPGKDYFYQRPIIYDNSKYNVIGFVDNKLYKSIDEVMNPHSKWTMETLLKD